MGRGLAATFHLLAVTKNEAAVGLLISALESRHAVIEQGALGALLDRRSQAGGREILRRLHLGGRKWKEMIDRACGRLSGAVRDAVLSTDEQLCRNGCQAALWFHEFDSMSALINAAEDRANPNASPDEIRR